MQREKVSGLLSEHEIQTLRNSGHEVDYMYFIVRAFNQGPQPSGCRLSCGDLLKLGRIKFFIRELCFLGSKQKSDSNVLFMRGSINCEVAPAVEQLEQGELLSKFSCRVCLSDTFTRSNPLINACKCKGSVA